MQNTRCKKSLKDEVVMLSHIHTYFHYILTKICYECQLFEVQSREKKQCLHCYCLRACICLYHMHSTRFHLNIPQQPFLRHYYRKGDKKCSPRVDYDNSYANYSHTALFLQAHGFDQVTPTFARPDYSLKLHRAPTRALAHLIWCFSAALQAVEGKKFCQ